MACCETSISWCCRDQQKKGRLQQAPPKNISKIWKDFPILSQQGILKKESFYLIYRNLPWKRWNFLIHPCSSTKSFRELLSIILWWPNCSNFWERFAVPVPRSHRAPECQLLPETSKGFMILGKLRVANGHGVFLFLSDSPRDPGSPNVRGWERGVQSPPKRKMFRFHETILRFGEPGSLQ